jgi:protein ImuA
VAHPAIWRADQLGHTVARGVPTQYAALDAELPAAGWPAAQLIELLVPRAGIGELRLLLPTLAQRSQGAQGVMLVAPPAIPYAPALAAHGVVLDRLLVVQAPQRADRLWTIEQALRSASLGAFVAWLPEEHGIPVLNDQLRRLQLAAQASNAIVFAFRPPAARANASPAPLRIALAPAGIDRLELDIFKRQGAPLAAPIVIDLPASTAARDHAHLHERTRTPPEALPSCIPARLPTTAPAHA